MRSFPAFALTACAILSACTQSQDADFNPNISVETVRILSSAEFAGREAGTDGGRRSADKIIRIIEQHSKFKPTRQNFAFMPNDRPLLNLNLDMIAQNQKGELYMAGSYHTPALKQLVQNATQGTGIDIKFGHDRPEDGDDDWTSQSDHSVFHKTGVPFVYFGVEDHKHYHKPTDTFETLPIDFYIKSLHAITNTARALDANLAKYAKPVSN